MDAADIPIFDSLAHPTLTGRWLDREIDARFETLVAGLREAGIARACAIGMAGRDGYGHGEFLRRCRKHDALVPVAGLDPAPGRPLVEEFEEIVALGYPALKIHPRAAGATTDLRSLAPCFRLAARHDLVVFYCTYMHGPLEQYPASDPFYALVDLLKQAPGLRVVLVHGGDVSLLKYAELVRFNPSLLLDLSLTMLKYRGSSLDQDLRFVFRLFDRRICIGTDFPEYSQQALRDRFVELGEGVGDEKLHNIGHRNLETFLAI